MKLTVVEGLQSEIFVPITPPAVWTPMTKPVKECTVAFLTAGGVHLKTQEPFHLAGDFSFRLIPSSAKAEELMVTHGGYDNSDVNKDINAMMPVDRLRELEAEGFIGKVAPHLIGFMGGGGNVQKFLDETGPGIAKALKEDKVDIALLTAG